MRVFADHVPAVPSLVNFASLLVHQVAPQCPTLLEMRLFIAVVSFQNQYGLLCRPFGAAVPKMGKLPGLFLSPVFLQCLVTTPRLSLMVGHALRDHFVLRSVESVRVLPDGFALADAGVATHVRRIVLRDHTIDQELAFAGAIVHRSSGAEVPTHGGPGIIEICPRGASGGGGPSLCIG